MLSIGNTLKYKHINSLKVKLWEKIHRETQVWNDYVTIRQSKP